MIPFVLDSRNAVEGAELFFPEPEILGYTGGTGFGLTGLYGNHMASIVPLDSVASSCRVYLTRRTWHGETSSMDLGYVDAHDVQTWPSIAGHYRSLIIDGLPKGCQASQPYVIRREEHFELFFWVHGGDMVRYVKCSSSDGIRFQIENLDNPCLYHPNDKAVRATGLLHGFSLNRGRMDNASATSIHVLNRVSNDATTVNFDHRISLYQMYSVLMLEAADTPKRRIGFDNIPDFLRVIHRRTSPDGIEWSEPEIVLAPDSEDPVDLQFYVMQQAVAAQGAYLVAGYYPGNEQTMELMPALTLYGQHIQRPRLPWRIREQLPSRDWQPQMLLPGGMIESGGYVYVSATACNYRHNERSMPGEARRQENLVLRQLKERWVGYKNHEGHIGRLVTTPFPYERLRIIAADVGRVHLTLLSVFGSELVRGGTLDHDGSICFQNNVDSAWEGKWVRLAVDFDTEVFGLKSQ